jgi:predicted RNase H-like nuclease (RuvC/YqgF family)
MPLDEKKVLQDLKKLEEISERVNKLSSLEAQVSKLGQMELEIKKASLEIEAYKNEISRLKVVADENVKLKAELATLLEENQRMTVKLDEHITKRPAMNVMDISNSFKRVLVNINEQQAKDHVMIENMEVEVKGGISLDGGVVMQQMLPGELTPQSVSTIRFTLRPVSTIKVDEE